MRSSFAVYVTLDNKPLPGVKVEIHRSDTELPYVQQLTDTAGRVSVRTLPPGEYWIAVKCLDISAGYHCFHVRAHSSLLAKGRLNYPMGDYGISMNSVRGHIRDWQPGAGGTLLCNLTHGASVPISGANARLQNATTGETLASVSDASGEFAFPPVKDGTYVLHIEGGHRMRMTPRT